MASSGHGEPAGSSGAAPSSFENVISDEGIDDTTPIFRGVDEDQLDPQVHQEREPQQEQVRVREHEQGQPAQRAPTPTAVSSGNEIGPSVSQVNTPERRGQVELPPESWTHPNANGPPRRIARVLARPPPTDDDDQAWASWNANRQAHQRVDHAHRWDQPSTAGPWPAEQWSSQQWSDAAWEEQDWDDSGWHESATYTRSSAPAGRLFTGEGRDSSENQDRQNTSSTSKTAYGSLSDDQEIVTVDKMMKLLPMIMDSHLERQKHMSKLRNESKDDENESTCDKDTVRPYVRHRENGYGLLYAQQALKNQEAMVSGATYSPPFLYS